MKKLLLVLSVVAMASLLFVGCLTTPQIEVVVTLAAIPGVTAPVTGATPVTATTATAQYTGEVTWLPDDTTFAAETVYTATITLTTTAGFTLTGVAVDFFTVADATTATNPIDSGVVTAEFPATAPAPVTPVAPTITTIPDQEVFWDEEPWTYQVDVTPGTGTISDYNLTGNPTTMSISSAGLITWTTILNQIALHEVTVRVDASDGEFDTETFAIEVKVPIPPDPLTATIWYNPTHSYSNAVTYVRGYAVPADAVPVEVTLSEALATGESIQIQWNDGTAVGDWEALTQIGTTLVYEGTVTFDEEAIATDCKLVCVEVQKVDEDFCPGCDPVIILQDTVKVDSVAPELDLNITFGECTCPSGAYFTFEPNTYGDCLPLVDDCCDECSGIDGWTIEDADPCVVCPTITGTGCPDDTYACGCLLYADGYNDQTGADYDDEQIVYKLKFTFTDNVGNAIVDTWAITLDTDSVVGFANNQGTPPETNEDAIFDVEDGTVNILYSTCCEVE